VQARKDAACWLGCGRANIIEAGTRGRRAVIAPRERKLRRTYTPRASPARARALQIPGAMGRCRRGTPIGSKDGRLCACGLCPRASPVRARTLRIPGLEVTGGVPRKLEAEASRGEHYRQLIPVKLVTPLVDGRWWPEAHRRVSWTCRALSAIRSGEAALGVIERCIHKT
jgi:hypothetical protein